MYVFRYTGVGVFPAVSFFYFIYIYIWGSKVVISSPQRVWVRTPLPLGSCSVFVRVETDDFATSGTRGIFSAELPDIVVERGRCFLENPFADLVGGMGSNSAGQLAVKLEGCSVASLQGGSPSGEDLG